jgi:hypothetical protein
MRRIEKRLEGGFSIGGKQFPGLEGSVLAVTL